MGTHSEQHSAARQFYADAQPVRSAREVCEEDCDDAAGRMIDEWAERLVRRGIARILAQRCAEVVVAEMGERDRKVVGMADGAEVLSGRVELLEGLRAIGIKIYQAPKRGVAAGALVLATGATHRDFGTARELAARQSVSPELAANAVEDWQRSLQLPKTSGQKSDEAKRTYKDTNGKLGRNAA